MEKTVVHKLLKDTHRTTIVNALQYGKKSASELADICQTSKSNLSQHLGRLYEHGIVKWEKVGRHVYYQLSLAYRHQFLSNALNEAVMIEIFSKVVHQLYRLQRAMETVDDVVAAHEAFTKAVHFYMKQAYEYALPHPTRKGDYISFFSQSVDQLGIPSLQERTLNQSYPVIDRVTGKLHPFWVDWIEEKVEEEGEESKNFLLIREWITSHQDQHKLMNAFIRLRHVFSDPKTSPYYSKKNVKKMLKPFEDALKKEGQEAPMEMYAKLHHFFESIQDETLILCPHCKRPLSNQEVSEKKCLHWRCNEQLLKEEEQYEPHIVSLDNQNYMKLTDWVTRFIRIPGIEEERIGHKTSRIVTDHPHSSVEMNPDGDRVDILVMANGQSLIQGDVKDFTSPYHLASSLNDYAEWKVGELDRIYIIVPRDTLNHYPEDYLFVVRRFLEARVNFLEVVSEEQWYSTLRQLKEEL
ncbi:metalloregulator ArsR/SmtB family transcription factor [Alkalihalobacillus sp. R86527]|uniref:metalloregulator ArsR/SmtB family transcription factor n=1 Tax=Alkalihalobacillus sp. R86527 TaxID=3093863 RepID=UPI00366FD0BF